MDSLSIPSGSLQSTETTNAIRSQPQFITVPIAASIASGAAVQTVRTTTLGPQIALKDVTTVGTPILIALPKVINAVPINKTVSTSSVITFAPSIPGLSSASTIASIAPQLTIRNIPEVDIREVTDDHKAIVVAANGDSSNRSAKSDEVIELDDLPEGVNPVDHNWTECKGQCGGLGKTKYVCDNCSKGFCHLRWLDKHKLQNKACLTATATTVRAPSTPAVNTSTATTGSTSITISTSTPTLAITAPPTMSNKRERENQSGRPQELLQCPNSPCTFATYWLQSLTKHVTFSCKYNPTATTSEGVEPANASQANVTKPSAPVSCTKCSKKCNDIQEHIEHMTTVHKMKASYRCSTCAQTFPTKVAVEAHLQTHTKLTEATVSDTSLQLAIESDSQSSRSKTEENEVSVITSNNIATNIEIAEEEDDDDDMTDQNSLNEVYKCDCGKVYLQKSSYELHCKSCPSHSKGPGPSNSLRAHHMTNSRHNSVDSGLIEKPSVEYFTQDYIQLIHDNDYHCKSCNQEFSGKKNLCYHLNGSESCKEWYCKNTLRDIQHSDKEGRKDRVEGVVAKRRRLSSESVTETPKPNPVRSPPSLPKRAASIAAQSTLKLSLTGHYVESKEAPGSFDTRKLPNPVECPKCFKSFGGRAPQLSLKNHLRCSNSCANNARNSLPYTAVKPLPGSPLAITSPNFRNGNLPERQIITSINMNKIPMEVPQPGVKYCCKLCPSRPIKNRVSLGTHLTIYHGLPPVNVASKDGDSFRCQTCRQLFNSKYFYNMHRYECDLTSPYVGVLSEDGTDLQESHAQEMGKSSSNHVSEDRKPNDLYQTEFKCTLCGRGGFSGVNGLKMHQKYQCVKRTQVQNSRGSHFANTARPKSVTNSRFRDSPNDGDEIEFEEPSTRRYCSELARMNDLAKKDATLTMCDACGRGPYNSYYYLLEHKRQFCRALQSKGGSKQNDAKNSTSNNDTNSASQPAELSGARAIKSIVQKRMNVAKKSFPNSNTTNNNDDDGYTIITQTQTARKSMNTSNAAPNNETPQLNKTAEAAEDVAIDVNDQSVVCSVCSQQLANVEQFVLHRLKHAIRETEESTNPDTGKCEICGARINNYQRMQQHFLLHLQNYNVIHQKDLVEIKRKKPPKENDDSDDDEPLLSCPYCKASYISRIDLANHIRTSCPSRYQCPHCERTYLTKESLTDHKEQCIKRSLLRSNSALPAHRCKSCGLEFRVKQQLMWHEHACSKVYTADVAAKVEDMINRALTCGICGLTAKDYDGKSKHERRCLQRYLYDVGFFPGNFEDTNSDLDELENRSAEGRHSTQSNNSLDEEAITKLKDKYGIAKELKVALRGLQNIGIDFKAHMYEADDSDGTKLVMLKEAFRDILRLLVNDDEVFEELTQEDSAEVILARILENLGQNPVEANNGLNELAAFTQNLQLFLNVSIKEATLEKANLKAESVEEVINNLLRFPSELK